MFKWKSKKNNLAKITSSLFLVAALGSACFLFISHDRARAAAYSTLSFNPSTPTETVGSNFTLDAKINPGTNLVSGAALRITFDPAVMSLTSITPSAAFSNVQAAAVINNTNGTASIDLGVPMQQTVTTISTVATFTFHALAAATNSQVAYVSGTVVVADDDVGNNVLSDSTPASVTVTVPDTTPPSGGSISYQNGYLTSQSVALTVDDGADASGINTSSRIVKRQEATLANGTCASYGSLGTITPTGTYPNLTDSTVVSGKCYKYQYLVSDSASSPNQATYTSTNEAKIDNAAPSGASISYVNGYRNVTSVSLTASDGTDAVSGVNTGSRAMQRKSATLTGTSCGSFGNWGSISPTGTYPNFTDVTVANGNCYQYQYLISDGAGNQGTNSTSNVVKVDTVAPTVAQVTAVASKTRSATPSYVFSSDEAGTIQYGGDCTSGTGSANTGNTTIAFSSLSVGTHASCTVRVTDAANNQSSALSVSSFIVTYRSDFNLDQTVDMQDYGTFHANYANNSCGNTADMNGDCHVDMQDYGVLHSEYGSHF